MKGEDTEFALSGPHICSPECISASLKPADKDLSVLPVSSEFGVRSNTGTGFDFRVGCTGLDYIR